MIVLDTHVLIWWVSDPARLAARARELVDGAVANESPIAVSSISIWEIAMLVAHGRLALTINADAWIAHLESLPFLSFVPVDNRTAVRAVGLAEFPHKDPADRIIVATAVGLGATLVTADRRLLEYGGVATVWE